jgi:uncharacterized protein (TIGR01777 family)
MKRKIILAGGSGFIGQTLSALLLANGYEVVVLTRSPSRQEGGVHYLQWDGLTIGEWVKFLDGAKALVNLTGRSVNCRHTPKKRREIVDSRVNSVSVLGEAVARCARPPETFLQAGGIAIYGDTGDRWADENAPHGHDFLAEVCKLWEGAFAEVHALGMRKSVFRIAPALSANGGFLKPLGKLTRWFLGGHVGTGRQYISWIHLADLCRMFLCAIERDGVAGVFNATSPNPATNADFMRELRRALHRPWSPPVPNWVLPIGSRLMQTETSLALTSCRAMPKHFLDSSFEFEFPDLKRALAKIYSNQ